ncbi:MAG: sigma-70 family RNA polymerase sigma factor [Calditrichaeota bacterium]|nr:sigma-70 family RNA polymerase sigma factor [Calditrichota bacterium]
MKRIKFEKYVSQYKDLVYTQAYYFTGNSADAQDIAQEALVKLWRHFGNLSKKSVKSWLTKVTRNLCIDYSRKRREMVMDQISQHAEGEHFQSQNPAEPSRPDDELELADLQSHLKSAIGKLPEKIRETIILREIQGFSYEEIADALNIPLNSVKVYLHRGRKLLAKFLKPIYED